MNSNSVMWKVENMFHFLCGDGTHVTEGIFHNFNSNETGQFAMNPTVWIQRVQNNYMNTRNILRLSVLFTAQRCHYIRLLVSRDCSLFYQFPKLNGEKKIKQNFSEMRSKNIPKVCAILARLCKMRILWKEKVFTLSSVLNFL